ncbi:hypothetical protein KUM39_02040 [Streptomyces sp. J2-1]|uniref:hypothetical protein n=1 Tax=Streptomyces corallincola TaxID=2851888 RepID=UPI001C389BD3|nr:hypothetical protein [Streptomyces corallincola]MBV2353151.1 hypothetical protein [Streptomyces corallincola]
MISIEASIISAAKLTDSPTVSLCVPGTPVPGTGLSGVNAARSASSIAPVALLVREGDERPTWAPAAAEAQATAYAFAATGAGFRKQTTQHHQMWAFRGPEPWSDPA